MVSTVYETITEDPHVGGQMAVVKYSATLLRVADAMVNVRPGPWVALHTGT